MNFRLKALAKLREPDELDAPVALASPRGWMAVITLTAVVLGAVAWGIFGRLPQTVTATGMITRPQGAAGVQSLYAGMVTKIGTSVGGQVSAGQVLAVIRDATGASHDVVSPYAGQVLSVGVTNGQVIGTGSQVATIEPGVAGDPLVALLFVPSASATGIVPGEQVKLSVASAPSAAFGLLRGQVMAVSQFPLTNAEVNALLGGAATAAAIGAAPNPRLITVRLLRNGHTPSGYAWTTAAGPPMALPAQVPATGTVVVGSQAPISLLFSR